MMDAAQAAAQSLQHNQTELRHRDTLAKLSKEHRAELVKARIVNVLTETHSAQTPDYRTCCTDLRIDRANPTPAGGSNKESNILLHPHQICGTWFATLGLPPGVNGCIINDADSSEKMLQTLEIVYHYATLRAADAQADHRAQLIAVPAHVLPRWTSTFEALYGRKLTLIHYESEHQTHRGSQQDTYVRDTNQLLHEIFDPLGILNPANPKTAMTVVLISTSTLTLRTSGLKTSLAEAGEEPLDTAELSQESLMLFMKLRTMEQIRFKIIVMFRNARTRQVLSDDSIRGVLEGEIAWWNILEGVFQNVFVYEGTVLKHSSTLMFHTVKALQADKYFIIAPASDADSSIDYLMYLELIKPDYQVQPPGEAQMPTPAATPANLDDEDEGHNDMSAVKKRTRQEEVEGEEDEEDEGEHFDQSDAGMRTKRSRCEH